MPKKQAKPVPVQEQEPEQKQEQEQEQEVKSTSRPGRTLLVKSTSNSVLNDSVFSGLDGLKNKADTKTSSSVFLTFDTGDNAKKAMEKLSKNNDVVVKYSYYRLFFTMSGLTDTSDYNVVKKELGDYVEMKTGSSVLYCKLYRKGDKYIGCGDFTIDTMEGMNTLLLKENNLKDYSLGKLSGTFYRYNANKTQ